MRRLIRPRAPGRVCPEAGSISNLWIMHKLLMPWRQGFQCSDTKFFLNARFVWGASGVKLLIKAASMGLAG